MITLIVLLNLATAVKMYHAYKWSVNSKWADDSLFDYFLEYDRWLFLIVPTLIIVTALFILMFFKYLP